MRENTTRTLTSKQRAHLRSLAHALKPVVHIGKEGVTDASAKSASDAFNQRELIKVKVLDTAPGTARETGEALAERIQRAQVVQVIGRVVTLYCPHPDRPEIALPGEGSPVEGG